LFEQFEIVAATPKDRTQARTSRSAEALLAGVPVVVVPGGGDQWELANRVVRQGSARVVRPLSADTLIAGVTEVLSNPGYRQAARRAGDSIVRVADPVAVCRSAMCAR
jgi:UDP:flavonoid glycosyltransferase YjiC (YdhE family)